VKVAVIGLSPRSHHLAPWSDSAWQLWGLAWDADFLKLHRTFEIHESADLEERAGAPHYFARLALCHDLYMQEPCAQVPSAKRYPREQVDAVVGDYLASSIAYAVALAICEGAEEIGLWGVDMKAADEYFEQRPNLEYLIGFARGRGIKVHIPDSSPLCKFAMPGFAGRYGLRAPKET
jgi:hypothetical protein